MASASGRPRRGSMRKSFQFSDLPRVEEMEQDTAEHGAGADHEMGERPSTATTAGTGAGVSPGGSSSVDDDLLLMDDDDENGEDLDDCDDEREGEDEDVPMEVERGRRGRDGRPPVGTGKGRTGRKGASKSATRSSKSAGEVAQTLHRAAGASLAVLGSNQRLPPCVDVDRTRRALPHTRWRRSLLATRSSFPVITTCSCCHSCSFSQSSPSGVDHCNLLVLINGSQRLRLATAKYH